MSPLTPFRCLLICLATILSPLAAQAQAASLPVGSGTYTYTTQAGASLKVFYQRPASLRPDSPVVVVMHGVNRDADRYYDEWKHHAEKYQFLLVVPEFSQSDFPGDGGYILGNVFTEAGTLNPVNRWAYSVIEPLFDDLIARSGNTSTGYFLYGHSAGSQFVHRLMYFQPQARVISAITANAGWYTLPSHEVDFPYGLRGTPVTEANLRGALGRPLLILLGTRDNDPNHSQLRRAPEAMLQGHHRFERGHTFYFAGEKAARALGTDFNWKLQWVPGVAHQNRHMAVAAVEHWFGKRD